MCPVCGKSIDIKLEEVLFSKLLSLGLQGNESAAAQWGREKKVRDAGLVFVTEMGAAWVGNADPGYSTPQNPTYFVRAAPQGLCSVAWGCYELR